MVMRSFTTLDLQYAHRFYGFKGEAQYLHGHTGVLTIEVEDTVNTGVNMAFPCNEIQKTAWDVLQNFDHALVLREDDPLSLIQRNGLKAIDSKETHQQIVDIMEGGYEAFKRRNVIYSTWEKN
jgi:6-pyruvoyl-tetrahydropterin synthase